VFSPSGSYRRALERARWCGVALIIADGVIAATALDYALTLVTRTVKDFAGLGMQLLNP